MDKGIVELIQRWKGSVMENKVNVEYTYRNVNKGMTRVWTTLPLDTADKSMTHKPEITSVDAGQNKMYYFTLDEGEVFQFKYSIDTYQQDLQKHLSEEEKAFYLRSGTLVVVDKDMKDLANSITAQASTVTEKARAIFDYVVDDYKYVYPPKSRGSKSFLQTKKGDCGEYSFLFASLCRSIGIPCRTIIGSWANGKTNAHVWNEFFVEDSGWIPVDCSVAYMQKKKKSQFLFGNNRTLHWAQYFGRLENQRVVFSKDAELVLNPSFEELDEQDFKEAEHKPYVPFNVDGEPFYWSYQSLHGAAPYMQPIYAQFDRQNLQHPPSKDGQQYLGQWKITETGLQRFFYVLKGVTFGIFVIGFLINFFLESHILELVTSVAIVLTCVSFVARKERTVLFSLLTLYFLLVLVARLL